MNRYDRQIRVPQVGRAGQARLAAVSVVIVGCGATGTHAAEILTRAGVGALTLIDPDVIELTNLQRQTLFTEADLGALKVEAAVARLTAIRTDVQLTGLATTFDEAIFDGLTAPDLLLDCTDNFLARESINDYCLHYQRPFVFAAAAGVTGQVMALQPATPGSPCLACLFPDLAGLATEGCDSVGVVTPLIPLVAGMQTTLALRILTERDFDDWTTLRILDSWGLQLTDFSVNENPSCAICHKTSSRDRQLRRTCGGVFQGFVSQPDFSRLLSRDRAQLTENPLATRLEFPDEARALTAFKNGRVLLYGFDSAAAAEEVYQQL